ncbi:hypothetical protein [Phaeobacter sp. B1627]|uniref:hypothetical protein n=1 Tax=Phaeobacter sp. B1627 TaxID=2583809 RepID=UPI0011181B4F|nr:hypothetical protein [Phaeobacter sp. B1627]TNJ48403.1 hypothetical protein FGE21_00175 [Phaeobacter sp. B1627]
MKDRADIRKAMSERADARRRSSCRRLCVLPERQGMRLQYKQRHDSGRKEGRMPTGLKALGS